MKRNTNIVGIGDNNREWSLLVESESLDVGGIVNLPEPKWLYTDDGGHKHRWMIKKGRAPWVTNTKMETKTGWILASFDYPEEYTYQAWICNRCNEEIFPVFYTKLEEETVKGVTVASGCVTVSEEEYLGIMRNDTKFRLESFIEEKGDAGHYVVVGDGVMLTARQLANVQGPFSISISFRVDGPMTIEKSK